MDHYSEKPPRAVEVQEDEEFVKPAEEIRVVIGDEAFQQAMIKEPPRAFSKRALVLYACSLLGFFCSTTNGYDGSLFGTLLVNPAFKSFFGVQAVGIWPGIVTSMYQIGQVIAIPFIGPAIDTWGRRAGMFMGGFIIFIGVVIQGTCVLTHSTGQFMGGRFLLGLGVGIIASAGPVYVVEISHPAHRGIVTGLYNVFWPVGALVASGACRGGLNYGGNTSWLIPVWLQAMFPGLIVLGVFFLPESPRWLYVNGKMAKAKETMAYYHGNGNPESEWVKLQLAEYESHLELDGADKRWWDYRALFKDRASRYRLGVNCLVSLFGQWAGNGVVTYFLSGFLNIAGIKSPNAQNNIQLGMNALQIAMAITGALFIDKLGRRPLLIWTNVGCCICWIGVTVATAQQASTGSAVSSKACLAMVYLFQICYSFGWTPLQALYPVEVLSFEMRAKGMAFSNLFVAAGGMVSQFGFPVALQNIAWKTYIVFCVWCAIQAIVIYFLVPETKNRTLEELDGIFNAPNPRKASTQKKKLELDGSANIVGVAAV
jgi:sugar porter (SP) family MFS transporter